MKKVKMFAVAVVMAVIVQAASALEANHTDDARQQMTTDQLRVAVQEICPVTGQKLGAHGKPLKAKIGQEEVFLCCEGCRHEKVDPGRWAAIHANIAKAQAKCPVMGEPLRRSPKSTVVEGRIVYICCPPCAKKIEADPKLYLKKVDEFYAASIKANEQPAR